MASPRAVRIPRAPSGPRRADALGPLLDHRPNTAGSQRAFRFALLYLTVLVALDLVLVGLDLTSAEASRPGVQAGLQLFLGVAIVLAVGSVVYALSPAPRYVDIRTDGVIVVGRWGRRVWCPPVDRLDVKVVRHYRAGWLSHAPVDIVQVTDVGGRERTFQVERGLFAAPAA